MARMARGLACTAVLSSVAGCCLVGASRRRVRRSTDLSGPDAAQWRGYMTIGGIGQYVQVRGHDRHNPVVLWVHGGPGYPLTYLSRHYQQGLEERYTVATWEQRGSGRTHRHGRGTTQPELTLELLLSDMDELVDRLRSEYGRGRVVLLGQSWGTVLATEYLQRHPGKVSAYIGTGQVVDFKQGKIEAAHAATALSDRQTAMRLEEDARSFAQTESVDDMDAIRLERMVVDSLKPLRGDRELSGMQQLWFGLTSPDFTMQDLRWLLAASDSERIIRSQRELVNYMYYRYRLADITIPDTIPVCFIQGQSDWITPSMMVRDLCRSMPNHDRRYIEIAGAGHTPFLDNPTAFNIQATRFLDTYRTDL
ncbi:alpha/beta fold hydrolase [Bifidobacterium cuniculi]|uniref:Alpha/beta hydrolase family protein n=1 Tax=Bifidobacterium cuniculi TaxID=1688 RepID=A0A087AZP5_9BIFI|nr:alpha/beta hydrolase [Bifidobacterium cuniculi]KFI64245.1 alpha/beta hydrolase family protein [Bifidobacterium cuniculi]